MGNNADNILELLIRLKMVGEEDVRKATALFDQVKDSAKGVNNELTDGIPDSETALRRLRGEMKDSGEDAEGLALKGRQVHMALHKINEIAPGVGTAMMAMFNPATLGITAILLALTEINNLLERNKQLADEAAAAEGERLEAFRKASGEAVRAQWELNDAMAAALSGGATEKYLNDLREQKEILKANVEQAKALGGDPTKLAAFQENRTNELNRNAISDMSSKVKMLGLNNDDLVGAQAKAEKDGNTEEVKKLQVEIGKNARAMESLTEAIGRLQRETDTGEAVHKIHSETADKVTVQNTIKENPALGGMYGANLAVSGHSMQKEQAEGFGKMRELFAQHEHGVKTMISIVNYHLQHSTTLAEEVTALKTALATLSRRVDGK